MARKKLEGFNNIKHWLFTEIDKISKKDVSVKRKNTAAKKAAEKAREALWIKTADRRPVKESDEFYSPEDDQITATTHNRYVTRLRRDLEEMGVLAFDFDEQINHLILELPKYKKYLHEIDKSTYRTAEKSLLAIARRASLNAKNSKREALKKEHLEAVDKIKAVSTQNPVMLEITRKGRELANMSKREEKRKVKYQRKPRLFSGLEIFSLINKLLKTDEWDSLALGVALATGRRCAEVIHFGEFEPSTATSIKFSGLRKNKAKKDSVFTIPSLVDSKLVCDGLERLRSTSRVIDLVERLNSKKLHEAEFARQINGSVSASLNITINKCMNPEEKEGVHWVFKDSRALYARISYAVYRANAKKAGREPIQEIEFFRDKLIHTDMNETLSYMQFRLSDEDKLDAHKIKKAKDSASKLEYEDRLVLLRDFLKSDVVLNRRAFARMAIMLVSAVDEDPEVTINGAMILRVAGGQRSAALELAKMIKEKQLDKPNQILKSSKNKKPKIRKEVEVQITLTFHKIVEIEVDEDDDEHSEIDNAVRDAVWDDLDVTDYSGLDWDEF